MTAQNSAQMPTETSMGGPFDRARTVEGLSHRDSGRGGRTGPGGRIDGTPLGGILPFATQRTKGGRSWTSMRRTPGSANGSSSSATSAGSWSSSPDAALRRDEHGERHRAEQRGQRLVAVLARRRGRPGRSRRGRRARRRRAASRSRRRSPTGNGRRSSSERRAAISPASGWTKPASSGQCRFSSGPREQLGDAAAAVGQRRVADAERPAEAALDERDVASASSGPSRPSTKRGSKSSLSASTNTTMLAGRRGERRATSRRPCRARGRARRAARPPGRRRRRASRAMRAVPSADAASTTSTSSTSPASRSARARRRSPAIVPATSFAGTTTLTVAVRRPASSSAGMRHAGYERRASQPSTRVAPRVRRVRTRMLPPPMEASRSWASLPTPDAPAAAWAAAVVTGLLPASHVLATGSDGCVTRSCRARGRSRAAGGRRGPCPRAARHRDHRRRWTGASGAARDARRPRRRPRRAARRGTGQHDDDLVGLAAARPPAAPARAGPDRGRRRRRGRGGRRRPRADRRAVLAGRPECSQRRIGVARSRAGRPCPSVPARARRGRARVRRRGAASALGIGTAPCGRQGGEAGRVDRLEISQVDPQLVSPRLEQPVDGITELGCRGEVEVARHADERADALPPLLDRELRLRFLDFCRMLGHSTPD